jgi:hypothetical protein
MLWSNTAASAVNLQPTLLSNITSSVALGVYGNDEVGYGQSSTSGRQNALFWNGTAASAVDLAPATPDPDYPSVALATNGLQQVGWAEGMDENPLDPDLSLFNAVVWSGTAQSVVDLQNFLLPLGSFWSESQAVSIDSDGNIFGYATAP